MDNRDLDFRLNTSGADTMVSKVQVDDPVRANTAEEVNRDIDERMASCIRHYAMQPEVNITKRIHELEAEWDMERYLELMSSSLTLAGIVLGVLADINWLWLSGVVQAFLMLHSLQGWCPPVPFFRRAGIRTRQEIDREKYALKTLRGDFAVAASEQNVSAPVHARHVMEAVIH